MPKGPSATNVRQIMANKLLLLVPGATFSSGFPMALLLIWAFAALRTPAQTSPAPDMIFVKGGQFRMGDSTGNADEKPLHDVFISDFYLSKTEITVQQFETFIRASGYRTDAENGNGSFVWGKLGWALKDSINWRCDELGQSIGPRRANYPVLHVSWMDAAHYCNWLSEQENRKKVFDFQPEKTVIHPDADGYRLPTEAEWEYAAKAGSGFRFAGSDRLEEAGWFSGNARGSVHQVAQKQANALGIYDLSGNVWEWCLDTYSPDFYGKSADAKDPFCADQFAGKSLRGGSWHNNARHCRISNRTSRFADARDGNIGFRLVRRK